MGNYVSSRASSAAGKVVLSDGSVEEFMKPVTVAELMLEHPQQVVVELNSGKGGGKRPSALPADKKLEMGKVYLMLPMKRGRAATLSSDEARRVLLRAGSVLQSQSFLSSARILPFFAKICPAGAGDGAGFLSNNGKEKRLVVEMPEERCKPEFELPEVLEGRPEYLSRQISGKGTWKPSLDTIVEKKIEKKVSHWLF